ncbi:MAG: type II toxin-antitoxin system HipA family toxin [Bacteriovoracaceae bacterium]|jgi:HipA-like protein|nr:type II toxin-antitoxin system HipA family toxin [Bacteriovoracaceae bacterium]
MSFDFISIKKAHVYLRDRLAGVLEKKARDNFKFSYTREYISKKLPQIAIGFPVRVEEFSSRVLHPFFDNMIAEGWLLAHTEMTFRIDRSNRFALLMATGTAPIGAVRVVPLNEKNMEISLETHYKDNLKTTDMEAYFNTPRENEQFCPYCLEVLTESRKKISYFHSQCAKRMWGTTRKLKFLLEKDKPMNSFIKVIYGGSVSGYQKKGLFRLEGSAVRPISFGAQYILKPMGELDELPENEHITMAIAKKIGFIMPPFTIVNFRKLGNVFAIRRFDINQDNEMLRMEDMAQILAKVVEDKFSGSCEKVGSVILKNSSAPLVDIFDYWRRVVFSFFIGNGDMHLKNWSMLEHKELNGKMALSPC